MCMCKIFKILPSCHPPESVLLIPTNISDGVWHRVTWSQGLGVMTVTLDGRPFTIQNARFVAHAADRLKTVAIYLGARPFSPGKFLFSFKLRVELSIPHGDQVLTHSSNPMTSVRFMTSCRQTFSSNFYMRPHFGEK